jgi:hypothetical protein
MNLLAKAHCPDNLLELDLELDGTGSDGSTHGKLLCIAVIVVVDILVGNCADM